MSDQPTTEIRTAGADKTPANSREKRSRIVLIALAAIFGLLMIIQGPTLYNAFTGGGSSSSEPVTPSADASGNAAEGTPAAAAGAGVPVQAPDELRESDLPQRAETHELSKIDGFNEGDPFVALVSPPVADGTAASTDSPSGTTSGGGSSATSDPGSDAPGGDSEGSANPTTPAPTESTPESGGESTPPNTGGGTPNGGSEVSNPDETNLPGARLSVNDVSQDVSANANFPAANPVFVLSLVESTVVHVTLVDGAFSTGTESIAIELGETRTLVSQPDGVRYSVRYDEPLKK